MTKAERVLEDKFAMAQLIHLADYEKETLLYLIQTEEILTHLLKKAEKAWSLLQNLNQQDLPPGGAEEIAMDSVTRNGDYDLKESWWTEQEVQFVNQWWKKTFPEEPNPMGLQEKLENQKAEEEFQRDYAPEEPGIPLKLLAKFGRPNH